LGEIQIEAEAGSVLIQDSRLWHSAPVNLSDHKRVAVVNRWCPWWLSVDDYAPNSRFNNICRPLSKDDFINLPNELKPLMVHLCSEIPQYIQDSIIDRSIKAVENSIIHYENECESDSAGTNY
jgi:ectoine hydroxylase-related dioxygenase (phytanoyl-CoA dioxygenase family)